MPDSTPTPLTDDQVAADLPPSEIPRHWNSKDVEDELLIAWNRIASLLADLTALTRQLADYALLREAVNASTTACSPDCTDEHAAHCPSHDPARWLIDQQREIAALTRRVEELEAGLERIAGTRHHEDVFGAHQDCWTLALKLLHRTPEPSNGQ